MNFIEEIDNMKAEEYLDEDYKEIDAKENDTNLITKLNTPINIFQRALLSFFYLSYIYRYYIGKFYMGIKIMYRVV